MSDELHDEIEALNSIYGDGTLGPAGGESSTATYILQLPGPEASSLRLRFPEQYPETTAPEVLGTEHASGGRKGAGARDLELFEEAVRQVFQPGLVCLFDAVEEFSRLLNEVADEDPVPSSDEAHGGRGAREPSPDPLATMQPPPWTLSAPLVDMKSTFLAHVAPVSSPQLASDYIAHLLASDKRIRTATHNITAWRIRDAETGTAYQDSDDDGETAAGARVLHLMQVMDIWDAVVIVTRWYGGVKLGPRRFAVINAVAREGFVNAGMVVEKEKEKKKGK